MKVQKFGTTQEMTYEEVCHDLGFAPEVHFVEITTRGTISWTVGKPDEIRGLMQACLRKGYTPSRKLKEAN